MIEGGAYGLEYLRGVELSCTYTRGPVILDRSDVIYIRLNTSEREEDFRIEFRGV